MYLIYPSDICIAIYLLDIDVIMSTIVASSYLCSLYFMVGDETGISDFVGMVAPVSVEVTIKCNHESTVSLLFLDRFSIYIFQYKFHLRRSRENQHDCVFYLKTFEIVIPR